MTKLLQPGQNLFLATFPRFKSEDKMRLEDGVDVVT